MQSGEASLRWLSRLPVLLLDVHVEGSRSVQVLNLYDLLQYMHSDMYMCMFNMYSTHTCTNVYLSVISATFLQHSCTYSVRDNTAVHTRTSSGK